MQLLYADNCCGCNFCVYVTCVWRGIRYGESTSRVRATLARYPDANPERDLFPIGYITAKTQWQAPEYHGVACNPKDLCGKSINLTYTTPESEWYEHANEHEHECTSGGAVLLQSIWSYYYFCCSSSFLVSFFSFFSFPYTRLGGEGRRGEEALDKDSIVSLDLTKSILNDGNRLQLRIFLPLLSPPECFFPLFFSFFFLKKCCHVLAISSCPPEPNHKARHVPELDSGRRRRVRRLRSAEVPVVLWRVLLGAAIPRNVRS